MSKSPTRPQALIYCRVSTRSQEEDGASLQSQEAACRRMAAQLDHDVGRVTHEVHSGAELWDRPLLSIDRADIKAGRFAALIALDVDRLSRDPIHFAIIAQECERAGCTLHLVNAPLDTSPEGMLIAYVKGYAAQIERAKIKERSLRGKRYRLEQGKIHGSGQELYGYRRDKERGVRLIYEREAEVVREVFQWIAVERLSIQSIAARLTPRGTLPPRLSRGIASTYGKVYWHRSAVQRMVQEPAYKGETIAWRQQRDPKTGRVSQRPVEQQVRLEGVTPAIVDPAIWQTANDRPHTNRGEHTRNAKNPRLLRGLVTCARCGRRLVTTRQHEHYYYKCTSQVSVTGPCGARMARADRIEPAVWDEVAAFLQNPDLVAEALVRRREEGPGAALTEELATARRGLAKIDHQQQRLLQLYAEADDDTFPREAISEQLRQLGDQKRAWEATVTELEGRLEHQAALLDQLDQVRDYCARVRANLSEFTFEEKRMALEALGVQIVADGREWHLNGSMPIDGVSSRTYS